MLTILLPYDLGQPYLLWVERRCARISEKSANQLRGFGFPFSSEYVIENGAVAQVAHKPNYPSSIPLDLTGARTAVDAGTIKLSKKARELLGRS